MKKVKPQRMDIPDLITIRVHYGGKFEGETRYVGGEVDVLEEWDWYSWTFCELVESYVEPGCNDLQKFAFRVKNTNNFRFFKDESEYCCTIYHCIDHDMACLDVYVECGSLDVDVEEAMDPNDGFKDLDVDGRKHMEPDVIICEHLEHDVMKSGKVLEFDGLVEGLKLDGGKDLERDGGKEIEPTNDGELSDYDSIDVVNENKDGYVSEYEKSDGSIYEDEDAKLVANMEKELHYDKDCDHKKLKLQIGMRFSDVAECKAAVRLWGIINGHNLKLVKSEAHRIQAKCEPGCPWKLYASKLTHQPTCVIKTYVGRHECVRPIYNRLVTSGWIADRFMEQLKTNPQLKALEMQLVLRRKYRTQARLLKCYRAKSKAMEILRGTLEAHYAKIRSYLTELQKRDKEGTFLLKTYLNNEGNPVFQRVYVGFSALRKGFFIGCRRFICFDACFLKTTLRGALLAAVSKDCNQKMYPMAWAVVEKENEETWKWFMEKLFEDFGIVDGFGWTFMSDKQKGLINAVHALAPNAEHRHCARHIYANWRKKYFGDKFQTLFWCAVKSTCESDFKAYVDQMRAESNVAAEDFLNQNPRSFCKSLINSHNKLDTVDNNMCESFNSFILKFRDSPLIDMLDGIRLLMMQRLYDLHKSSESRHDVLCFNIRTKLEYDLDDTKDWDVVPSVGGKF